MNICKKMCFFVMGILCVADAMAKTCTVPQYTISYDCGEGTVKNSTYIPSSFKVTYGQQIDVDPSNTVVSGKVNTIPVNVCTPPEGKTQAGHEIWAGDTLVGGGPTLLMPFRYYFQSDIVIRPHYIGPDEVDPILWNTREMNLNNAWKSDYLDLWGFAIPGYGYIGGTGRCDQPPLNMANGDKTGYILEDESIFKNYGTTCYCKLDVPNFTNSKWVVQNTTSCAGDTCAINCAKTMQTSAIFRASVLSGAKPANSDGD